MRRPKDLAWWQRGIIYQIYPLSFQDSNGDGIGDLPGITGRLEHCRWLGCDAIWLSPVFPSPMADFGYDVSDYTDIHPLLGTLSDFDALVAEARRLGLRVLLDLVPSHTSGRHPWFLQSRSSHNSKYRNWYLWRDPAPGGGPPNNWLSVFGGSAWEFDGNTGQYYLHSYLKEQPDLNWRSRQVQEAIFEVMRFWLARGVSGFRIDSVSRLIKDSAFRDNPKNPDYRPEQAPYRQQLLAHNADQPEVHEVIARMRQVADQYDAVLIGEAYLPLARLPAYYGEAGRGLHFPFNFQLVKAPWNAGAIRRAIEQYEGHLAAGHWPNWVLGNHDNPRVATRAGEANVRLAAMLLLTLRGTPTLYFGDEIGMADVSIPPERARDCWERNAPGLGLGRDPERTPMQWDASPHAGFSTATPWLPVAENFRQTNVAAQRADPASLLSFYRRLAHLRRDESALYDGELILLPVAQESLLTYLRQADGRRYLVALNFSPEDETLLLRSHMQRGTIRLSTRLDREGDEVNGTLRLRGHEGLLVALRAAF